MYVLCYPLELFVTVDGTCGARHVYELRLCQESSPTPLALTLVLRPLSHDNPQLLSPLTFTFNVTLYSIIFARSDQVVQFKACEVSDTRVNINPHSYGSTPEAFPPWHVVGALEWLQDQLKHHHYGIYQLVYTPCIVSDAVYE